MLSIDKYREIYRILDSAHPVEFDCGTLCDSACCNNAYFGSGESYIYLLPGEKEYLESVGCEIQIVREKRSDHYLPRSWGRYVYIAHCPGADVCGRDVRPIQCRTFPLQPYIGDDGTLKMILSRMDLPYACPFVEGEAKVSYDFCKAAYEAWLLLTEDKAIRDLVRLDSKNIMKKGDITEKEDVLKRDDAADNSSAGMFPCPCCGNYTLPGDGEYDICPVCFWEDDPAQKKDPNMEGGANKLSLSKSRENYKLYGACEERFRDRVRQPLPEECPPVRGEEV